jgi:hypothetical protein
MKKQVKKLTLAKETLVYLEGDLRPIAGAATVMPCVSGTACNNTACPFSGYVTCGTCGGECGTNLC